MCSIDAMVPGIRDSGRANRPQHVHNSRPDAGDGVTRDLVVRSLLALSSDVNDAGDVEDLQMRDEDIVVHDSRESASVG